MNESESDPTGAFRGGSAGLEDGSGSTSNGTEYERHAPDGADAGGGQPNAGESARPDDLASSETPGVDETEREVITSGTAATSEVADPAAQTQAERQGDGTPLPG